MPDDAKLKTAEDLQKELDAANAKLKTAEEALADSKAGPPARKIPKDHVRVDFRLGNGDLAYSIVPNEKAPFYREKKRKADEARDAGRPLIGKIVTKVGGKA